MNILILNGGPRNGRGATCRKIVDAVVNESQARGWNVTVYDLDGMAIKPCRGCFACWLKHPEARGDRPVRLPRNTPEPAGRRHHAAVC